MVDRNKTAEHKAPKYSTAFWALVARTHIFLRVVHVLQYSVPSSQVGFRFWVTVVRSSSTEIYGNLAYSYHSCGYEGQYEVFGIQDVAAA